MSSPQAAQVVVCAGGLGTRVAPWARHIPKEFQPVAGRPAMLHLLDELTALAPARVVVVYHPFYAPFIAWAKTTLSPGAQAAYQRAARLPCTDLPPHEQLDLLFIPQRGPYADITSVLNAADRLLPGTDLLVAFADNLYPHDNASLAVAAVPPGQTAVLVRPYHSAEAGHRGVIVSRRVGHDLILADLIEKPMPEQARRLEGEHGAANLWLLEGRARLTQRFVDRLRHAPPSYAAEPKLSRALRQYAKTESVRLVITHAAVVDLGAYTLDRLATTSDPEEPVRGDAAV